MDAKSNIFSIIEEAIDLFKTNYKLFLTLSFLGAFCGLVLSMGNQLINSNDIINAVVMLMVVIFSIYFSVRLQIALIIAINNRYQNFETDFQECYKTAGSYFWSYLFTSIAFALLIGLSLVFIFFPISMEVSPFIIALCVLFFGGLALLLLYFFNFAPLVSVLNPEAPSNFSKSRELVKGQPRLVLSMLGIAILGQLLLYFSTDLLGINSFEISSVLGFIVDIFIAPIFTIVYVMVYFQLEHNNAEEENASEGSAE